MAVKKEIQRKARNEVARAKTADELNRIIAKYLDLLDMGKIESPTELRLAEMVSGFIGRQISVENAKLGYERLAILNNSKKKYAFAS